MRVQAVRASLAAVLTVTFGAVGLAQVMGGGSTREGYSARSLAANVIVPQRRAFAPLAPNAGQTVSIERVDARVSIVEQVRRPRWKSRSATRRAGAWRPR